MFKCKLGLICITFGVGSTYDWSHDPISQEYDHQQEELTEDEGEGEGFVGAPKGRADNCTTVEEILICTTWKTAGMDAAMGTKQPKDTYWARMKEFFDAYKWN